MERDQEDIQAFQDIWKQEFGEDLTMEQARLEATLLIELAAIAAEPLPGEDGYAGMPLIAL